MGQNDHALQIEFLDADGIACSRIELTSKESYGQKAVHVFSNDEV